jgi:hypothetical protein
MNPPLYNKFILIKKNSLKRFSKKKRQSYDAFFVVLGLELGVSRLLAGTLPLEPLPQPHGASCLVTI